MTTFTLTSKNKGKEKGSFKRKFLKLRALFYSTILFSFSLALVSSFSKFSLLANSEPITISGTILNGTIGKATEIEHLRLVKLEKGMQVLEKIEKAGPRFNFKKVKWNYNGPLLLQAFFQGTYYTKILPPIKTVKTRGIKLFVYELGAPKESIRISRAIHVIKKLKNTQEKFLEIKKTYVVENYSQPKRSFDFSEISLYLDKLERNKKFADARANLYYIPENAQQNPGSFMGTPIPLNLEKRKTKNEIFYNINRILRPQLAVIEIHYKIKELLFEDICPNDNKKNKEDACFTILSWEPKKATPQIKNGKVSAIQIPNLGLSYKIYYPQTLGKEKELETEKKVLYQFDKGLFVIDNALESDINPFFSTPTKTLLSIIYLLFSAFFIVFWQANKKAKPSKTKL